MASAAVNLACPLQRCPAEVRLLIWTYVLEPVGVKIPVSLATWKFRHRGTARDGEARRHMTCFDGDADQPDADWSAKYPTAAEPHARSKWRTDWEAGNLDTISATYTAGNRIHDHWASFAANRMNPIEFIDTKDTICGRAPAALLRTCKFIYQEAVVILYEKNTFVFCSCHETRGDLVQPKFDAIDVMLWFMRDQSTNVLLARRRRMSIELHLMETADKYRSRLADGFQQMKSKDIVISHLTLCTVGSMLPRWDDYRVLMDGKSAKNEKLKMACELRNARNTKMIEHVTLRHVQWLDVLSVWCRKHQLNARCFRSGNDESPKCGTGEILIDAAAFVKYVNGEVNAQCQVAKIVTTDKLAQQRYVAFDMIEGTRNKSLERKLKLAPLDYIR